MLFFDEANTTSAIGLIKEIMCDMRMAGKRLNLASCGLQIIAACNPYRKYVFLQYYLFSGSINSSCIVRWSVCDQLSGALGTALHAFFFNCFMYNCFEKFCAKFKCIL